MLRLLLFKVTQDDVAEKSGTIGDCFLSEKENIKGGLETFRCSDVRLAEDLIKFLNLSRRSKHWEYTDVVLPLNDGFNKDHQREIQAQPAETTSKPASNHVSRENGSKSIHRDTLLLVPFPLSLYLVAREALHD